MIDFGSLLGGFLEVMLALKIIKKLILTGNTEKGDFLILAEAKTLKLRF